MVTNRTPIRRAKKARFTPQILAAYRMCLEVIDDGDACDKWEKEGGRKREFLDASLHLHNLLGRRVWQTCITDTLLFSGLVGVNEEGQRDWSEALEIRKALDRALEAAEQAGEVG